MMRKPMFLTLAALAVASIVLAGTGNSVSGKPTVTTAASGVASSAPAAGAVKVEGTLQKIDQQQHSMTVLIGNEARVYKFDSKTQFLNNKKSAKATDLKDGEKVAVYADASRLAHRVDVEAAAPTAR